MKAISCQPSNLPALELVSSFIGSQRARIAAPVRGGSKRIVLKPPGVRLGLVPSECRFAKTMARTKWPIFNEFTHFKEHICLSEMAEFIPSSMRRLRNTYDGLPVVRQSLKPTRLQRIPQSFWSLISKLTNSFLFSVFSDVANACKFYAFNASCFPCVKISESSPLTTLSKSKLERWGS